ncbi:MAG: DUF1501 domain-containing protein [Planctomycetota bacterium]|nr:DUF1501 domain-containing protein [Planctomycetota bacterium]
MNTELPNQSRRSLLQDSALGFGTLALTHLLKSETNASSPSHPPTDLRARPPHFPARAKSVIMLLQNGAPSQMDLFDPKVDLQRFNGKKHPEDIESFQPGSENDIVMGSPFKFRKHGHCGMELSELLPHLGGMADELCLVRSMWSENNNHPQGLRVINTGKTFTGRPTLGAWVSYGLGTNNENLPAYVVVRDPDGYNNGGVSLWTNGFLPAIYGGTEIQSKGAPVLNLHPTVKQPAGVQRNNLELLANLNEERRKLYPDDARLEARIRNYELAARMQLSAETLLDISGETEATRKLYGLDQNETAGYGTRCLMARRMVESGVRFVLVTAPIQHGGMPWDHHGNLNRDIPKVCRQVDQPSAALVRDLKQRGLLDETIVLWTGEFGRLPVSQRGDGRDHNRFAFSLWLAGGGFRPGYVHGATDDFSYKSVESKVSCPDLLATLLHQLGLDHDELTMHHSGRDETLTDSAVTGAQVVRGLVS